MRAIPLIATLAACTGVDLDPHVEGDCIGYPFTTPVCELACAEREDLAPGMCSSNAPACPMFGTFDGAEGCCTIDNTNAQRPVSRWTACE